jgi:hypothetical protein
LGFLSHIRLAFASARFLSSALIFSIRVGSDVRILRVEFTCAPSENCFQQAIPIPEEGNLKKALLDQFETRCRLAARSRSEKTVSIDIKPNQKA